MTNDDSIEEASIADIAKRLRTRQLSCEELVTAYLKRISAVDKVGPSLNAFIAVDEHVLETARRMDTEREASGPERPLHGIPIVLKDNFDAVGFATTAGSNALQRNFPSRDAFVVDRLRRAGAIILGKTNLHEFALGGTTNSSLGGQTRNPYDLTRTPGGSSGGTGVAVAANLCMAGLGSDTVNSVRSPASALSLVGVRPTRGLLSRSGVVPVSPTQDVIGPLTRTVTDAATMLDCMIGYDPADAVTAWSIRRDRRSYTDSLGCINMADVRIGVLTSLFGDGLEHAEVTAVVQQAISVLADSGAVVVPVADGGIDVGALSRDLDVQRFEFREALNRYLSTSVEANEIRDLDDLIESHRFLSKLEGFLRRASTANTAYAVRVYKTRLQGIAEFRNRIMEAMAEQQVDVLVYPLQKRLVVPLDASEQSERNGIIAALTGFPAITMAAGFSSPTVSAPLGVPIGMDFLARPWSEHLLLNIAYAFENAASVRKRPRLLTPAPHLHWT